MTRMHQSVLDRQIDRTALMNADRNFDVYAAKVAPYGGGERDAPPNSFRTQPTLRNPAHFHQLRIQF